jgi:hypothetical protein
MQRGAGRGDRVRIAIIPKVGLSPLDETSIPQLLDPAALGSRSFCIPQLCIQLLLIVAALSSSTVSGVPAAASAC